MSLKECLVYFYYLLLKIQKKLFLLFMVKGRSILLRSNCRKIVNRKQRMRESKRYE